MLLPYKGKPATSFIALSAVSASWKLTNAWPRMRRFLCATTESTGPYVENSASSDCFSTVVRDTTYQEA